MTTKTDIRKRLETANAYLEKIGLEPLKVEIWSPGDGKSRYQIETSRGQRLINALGAGEAWEKLNAFMEGVYHATDAVKAGKFEAV